MAGMDQGSDDQQGLISGINITPFVDVVLVLLVIFMVTAPMLVKDILEIRLPKSTTQDGKAVQTLGIAVNKEGNFLLNGVVTSDEALIAAARENYRANPDIQAIIAADKEVIYGRVVKVIDLIKSAGIQKFAVQIERDENNKDQDSQ